MATERIVIIVSEDGTETVTKRISGLGDAATRSQSSVVSLQNALGLLGTAGTIKGVIDLLDTYQNLQNRLGLVSASQDEASFAMQRLIQVSERSRTSLETTGELYSRVALATHDLGVSHEQAAQVVETLNKAVLLSGATTHEAHGALIQFSQGLASGVLRGQELRSVLQQMPLVADLIAEKLGVTRGALRDLGAQGKITADTMIQALLGAGGKIDEAFAKTVPTVAQTMSQLKTQLLAFAGEMNAKFDIIPRISAAVKFLAANIESFGRIAIAGSFVFALEKAISMLNKLEAALLSNPFGIIATGVALAVAALVVFSDRINLTAQSSATLADFFAVVFKDIKGIIHDATQYMADNFAIVGNFLRDIFGKDMELNAAGFIKLIAVMIDKFVGFFIGAKEAIKAVFDNLAGAVELAFKGAINGILSLVERMINKIIEGYNKLASSSIGSKAGLGVLDLVDLGRSQYSANALEAGDKIKKAFLQGLGYNGLQEYVGEKFTQAEEHARERLAAEAKKAEDLKRGQNQFNTPQEKDDSAKTGATLRLEEYIKRLDDEREALQKVGIERQSSLELIRIEQSLRGKGVNLSAVERDMLQDKLREIDMLKEKSKLIEEVQGKQEANVRSQQVLNDLIQQGGKYTDQYKVKLEELQLAQLKNQRDMTSGFQRGLIEVNSTIHDFASLSSKVVTDAFQGMEDALVSFVKTGKVNFSSLVDSILADLTKLLFRQAIVGLLSSFGGGGLGSVAATAISGARADGGDVSSGKAYLVGERGPELFSPHTSGTIVPNGGVVGGQAQVNVHVVNVAHPDEAVSAMNTAAGEKVILNTIRKNRNTVNQHLSS